MSSNGDFQNPNAEFRDNRIADTDRGSRRDEVQERNNWLSIEIRARVNQPELLQGLEQWLKLNLISHTQVRKIAVDHLNCPLPKPEIAIVSAKQSISQVKESEIVTATSSLDILSRVVQGFLDELSIRWLLFLGIFLVIISSGVLAASQWQNFPLIGQYLILFVYTLGFWGIGFWTSRQDLKLTSQTLKAIAILLVPINFWAIDYLGLGKNLAEWCAIAVAAVILTAIVFRSPGKNSRDYFVPVFLLLSYLHLAGQSILSAIAIYGSIVIISFTYYRLLDRASIINLLFILSAWLLLLARELVGFLAVANYSSAIAIFSWFITTIYLTRTRNLKAIFLKQKSIAITKAFFGNICHLSSIVVLSLTWSISTFAGVYLDSLFFWQTIVISALAIHLFSQRLTLFWRKRDLSAIFITGLLTVYVFKELIPDSLRDRALDLASRISQTEYFPESIFGVTLFPYVIVFVFVASWLYRQQKSHLAIYAERLTLMFGIVLTCLSFSNPTWRLLNLLFSTLTLGYVSKIRQPARSSLIYLTHLLGLITAVEALTIFIRDRSPSVWGGILIALMIIEWGIYLAKIKPRINNTLNLARQSCWYFGLLLSIVSYSLFGLETFSQLTNRSWGLLWLITPGMLSAIAKQTQTIGQRRRATIFSCIALVIAQLLIFQQPVTRLIGLTIATGLMFINAFNLRRTIVTIIHLGFGLCLLVSLLNTFVYDSNWLLIGATLIWGLYWLHQYLHKIVNTPKFNYISQRTHGILGVGVETKNFKLIDKYLTAVDYWAIAIGGIEIIALSVISTSLNREWQTILSLRLQYLVATLLIIGAILWRYYQQPRNWILYTLTWLTELLIVGVVNLFGGSSLAIAIANIVLGSITLIMMHLWLHLHQTKPRSISNSPWKKLNLSYVPLIFAVLGTLWRLPYHNAFTGLLTLGVAWILINTRLKNHRTNLAIEYLTLVSISLGIYELVIYRISLFSSATAADNLTILALTAAAIAFCYRLIVWWYRQRQRQSLFNLNLSRVILVAHLHWAIGSIFKIMAATIAIKTTTPHLTLFSIATSLCLGGYAVIQGKDSSGNRDWWVYVGLAEIVATIVYSRLIISKLSLFDPWRIIFTCAVALLIYQIPWQNLGWRVTPWRRAAVIVPALISLVIAEDSYFSLLITALFYLRIAYGQRNIRWSYISLGFVNWGLIRLVWQYRAGFIWVAIIVGLSILYIAQLDSHYRSHRQSRHYLRIVGSSVICVTAIFHPSVVVPGLFGFSLIFIGLGWRIRAFLFSGTITLIFGAIYQLIILVMTYSFLKWILGLLAGISSIAIAAGFEKQRTLFSNQLKNYSDKLQDWQ